MSNKHVTISNHSRLHQFLTNHKFQVPAIFNTYRVFPTAIFSRTNSLQCLHKQRKDRQVLNQTDPQFWHCNDTENKIRLPDYQSCILMWHFYIHNPGEFLQPGTHTTKQLSDYDIFHTTRQSLPRTKSTPILFRLHT